MYKFTRLPNGLRVATAEMPQMESVAIGIWAGIGGRYERQDQMGVTHFIEHLLFKGTPNRTAKEISATVEGIGGYLNAFTGEENTCFYARASHRHFDTLLEVLADLYLRPLFDPGDIAKERQVIKEELAMYRDQPDHYVHELLTETLWPDQPLGWPLTGTAESLDAITRGALRAFQKAKYVAPNTIVAVAGRCEHGQVLEQVRNRLRGAGAGRVPRFVPAHHDQRAPRLRFYRKNVEQSHLAVGIRGLSRYHPQRYAAKLLSVILGENMSSRLFQVIREQHGLAYSIQSSTSYFSDTGALVVSAGLDHRQLLKALRLILRELRKLADRPPSPRELRHAKDYTVGQMYLGLESTINQMMWIAEHLMAYGFIENPPAIERKIEAVTGPELLTVAARLFRDRHLNLAVISQREDEDAVRKLLSI